MEDPVGREGEEELGGLEGGETIISIYWMRKEFVLNKGGKVLPKKKVNSSKKINWGDDGTFLSATFYQLGLLFFSSNFLTHNPSWDVYTHHSKNVQ